MKEMQFTIEIRAPKLKVWDTLWQDATFRQWAGLIDPGTHMVGELVAGGEVQFISGNGYGVTTLVEQLSPGESVLFRHQADTQEGGTQSREDQWTGGKESYSLAESADTTTLTATFDVPDELEEYFATNYPKALEQVKVISEATTPTNM